ncbi:MAG TPA: HAD family phosphatase [Planctomycetota bacterium]|nr:HAD family phosphatase [Planctomycetota bacterium]
MQIGSPAALLLDMDGTLVDTEPLHFTAHKRFLASQSMPVTQADVIDNVGKGDRSFFTALAARVGRTIDAAAWVQAKTDILLELYATQGVARQPGVDRLLDYAWREGIACCVVTSATRRVAIATLAAAGLAERLPSRVCAEDTIAHKPDPAPYLLACRRLDVPPAACVAIEDSLSGVAAARAAGCVTIGFAGLIPAEQLMAAGAMATVIDLAQLLPDGTADASSRRQAAQRAAAARG